MSAAVRASITNNMRAYGRTCAKIRLEELLLSKPEWLQ